MTSRNFAESFKCRIYFIKTIFGVKFKIREFNTNDKKGTAINMIYDFGSTHREYTEMTETARNYIFAINETFCFVYATKVGFGTGAVFVTFRNVLPFVELCVGERDERRILSNKSLT